MDPHAAFNAGVPALGTWVLYAFLVTAAFAFSLAVAAGTNRDGAAPRLLRGARMAALGTCALIAFDVLLLLYAFVSHDFRVRYVAHYSDRTMPVQYLMAALWGGQDGSLLWWTFLLSAYTSACVLWLKGRYKELAPWVIATLMVVVMFFGILMAFAANPFSANVAGAPPDGEGLNPSLQNFYMAIHPPSLYTGFVGCTVPFAFAMAALLSGRLEDEWIAAARKWALFAWLFLSIGNTLGMLWAYEELGWGGFWAWDPVENAACMPWFTATAFLHSIMIQQRRGTLKVWNISLVILTFLLTIFGTFLTRSGLIASIHSFAQSEIGVYFLYFLAFAIATSVALIALRYPRLKREMEIDAVLSREAMFVANNWLLLGIAVFIVIATTWPKISEWLWSERLTVGASFYNSWLTVPGAVLLLIMGIGTLTPWRKATPKLMAEAFRGPVIVGLVAALAHVLFGRAAGYPAHITVEPIYFSTVGIALAKVVGVMPAVYTGLIGFNLTTLAQEFARGTQARTRAKGESAPAAFVRLVGKNRRRYGGYVVHVGITLMFFGWLGTAWRVENEASLRPGESFTVGRYSLRYDNVEMHRDPNKREVIARVTAFRNGSEYARLAPAKFVYTTHPESPTSEVAIHTGLRDDVYVVMASVNPSTHVAHLKGFVNPFTVWIWLGCLVLIMGTAVAIWPELNLEVARGPLPAEPGGGGGTGGGGPGRESLATAREGAALLALLALASAIALHGADARAQGASGGNAPPMVAGESEAMTPRERALFDRMLCMCGDCQRLPLATCTCDFAAATRASMRDRLNRGVDPDTIVRAYVDRWGAAALAVPPDTGHNRGVYAIPLVGIAAAGAVGGLMLRRWRDRARVHASTAASEEAKSEHTAATDDKRAEYDRRLDEELRGLDD